MASGLALARFRCTGCGNCCRGLRVPLTHADLARIARASARFASELVEWLAPDQVDMSGEPSSLVELDVGRRLMVLRHASGGCSFLDGDACSIHPARPASCRAYPLDASFGRRGGIRRLRLMRDGVDCRHELDAVAERAAIRQDHRSLAAELRRYQRLVLDFNRLQRRRRRLSRRLLGAGAFLDFVAEQSTWT